MTKVTVITSGKGGVGKTSISVNAALELGRRKYRTCLFDADLGLANVNILLGINPQKTLDDYLFKGAELDEIIHKTEFGFDIIPASSGVEKMANLEPEQLNRLSKGLGQLSGYDHFLIDTSSGISRSVISFCLAAEETVIVITPEATSITDGYALLKVLSLNDYKGAVKILVNKCADIPQSKQTYLHFKSVADRHLSVEITPIGAILQDPAIERAVSSQQPVLALFPETIASQCIRAMAINLLGAEPEGKGNDHSFKDFWANYIEYLKEEIPLARKDKNQAPPPPPEAPNQQSLREPSETSPTTQRLRDGLLSNLPTPAPLWSTTLDLYLQKRLDAEELQRIISCDAALTLKCHQHWSSSETKNLEGETFSIPQIIHSHGVSRITEWLLNLAVQEALSSSVDDRPDLAGLLWHHSYGTALLAESLGAATSYGNSGEASFAGLLHNIGQLEMQKLSPELYTSFSGYDLRSAATVEAEKEYFGTDHATRSAELLNRYHIHPLISDCARYQNFPADKIATALPLTRLVYSARTLIFTDGDTLKSAVEAASSLINLPEAEIISCKSKAEMQVTKVAQLFKISQDNVYSGEEKRLLKRLAGNFMSIRSVLPESAPQSSTERVRLLYHGLKTLFHIDKVICMLPDENVELLQGVGSPHVLGSETASAIRISLQSSKSVVVRSFKENRQLRATSGELESLSDSQLLRVFKAEMLFTMPLALSERVEGVVVAGLMKTEYQKIEDMKELFKQFTTSAASLISNT